MNKTHQLKATPRSVHWGYFDASLPPVLEIGSGDTVVVGAPGEDSTTTGINSTPDESSGN